MNTVGDMGAAMLRKKRDGPITAAEIDRRRNERLQSAKGHALESRMEEIHEKEMLMKERKVCKQIVLLKMCATFN